MAAVSTTWPVSAATLPAGFQDTAVLGGLVNPTRVAFASDGRVFVAEKSGLIKVFDDLNDGTPSIFADLRTNVHNFWDRGLLGMVLAPTFPTDPSVYVLYTYDAPIGGAAPTWGIVGGTGDGCPNPPGATIDGCVVSARLSRLTANGNVSTGEQVLINDWCQQYPSHSIGDLVFGPDGSLYATGGEGASFTFADIGQDGVPARNPCGDPPGGVGTSGTAPTSEGGSLRSLDVLTIPPPTSPGYASAVASLNARAHWRLGETGGTTIADETGAFNGVSIGAPVLGRPGALVGDPNSAMGFDDVDDTVQVADNSGIDFGTTDFTVTGWFKTTSSGWGMIASKRNSTCPCSIGWTLGLGGNGAFHFGMSDGTNGPTIAPTSAGYRNGSWHFVAGVRSGSSATLYVDGVSVGSATGFGVNVDTEDPIRIGRTGEASTVFDGDIDEVAIFPSALSAAQVTQLYQAGTNPPSGGGSGGSSDPTGLDGTVIRINPSTGAAAAGNPLISSSDPGARRIVAYGLRNPMRFAFRPGTTELWLGDVGDATWEEINVVANPTDSTVENFGWPCYEGAGIHANFDALDLDMCESLYSTPGSVVAPYHAYNHGAKVVPGETCPLGSSSLSGMAFYDGGSYPGEYSGALFFADYSRDCIWAMMPGTNGVPDPSRIRTFVAAAAAPVDLMIGPGGDLFYVDFTGGTIHRVQFFSATNQPPVASISTDVSSGPAPLTVAFSAADSFDPDPGDTISYAWDLDADGQYDDSTVVAPTFTYDAGSYQVGLRVTDASGAGSTASTLIQSSNTPPDPTIDTPSAGLTWAVGDDISFTGSATDQQDEIIPASRLDWALALLHCPSNCHEHLVQTWSGVASGTFSAPDHDYPSYLELRLTATDSNGARTTVIRRLDPKTVNLSFQTSPTGLQVNVAGTTAAAPFSRTVIVGSKASVSVTSPQDIGGQRYQFSSWSDGGTQTHDIFAPTSATTYTATFAPLSTDIAVTQTITNVSKTATIVPRVENLGPLPADAVVLTDVLDSDLTYVSSSVGQGSCTFTASTRTVRCVVGTLAVGQVVTAQIVATSKKTTFDSTVTVTTTTFQIQTANDSTTVKYRLRR